MTRAARLALTCTLLICAAPAPMLAAMASKPAKSALAPFSAPRNGFGQPDMSGYWSNATLTPESRNPRLGDRAIFTPEEVAKQEGAVVKEVEDGNKPIDPNIAPKVGGDATPGIRPEFAAAGGAVGGYDRGWLDPGNYVMRVHGEARTSFLTTPNGQVPSRKAGAPPAPRGFFGGGGGARGSGADYENRSLGERCILSFGRNAGPPMFPNGFYNNNYQILQTPTTVVIQVEMVHDLRVIRLNGTHRTDGVRPWMGDSIGHWEGDTLVVETTNIPQRQAYRGSWEHLTVTERFTRTAKDRVLYQFTIDDPSLYDKAWGGEYEFSPLKGVIYEYACHEGNYALPGILAGARSDEEAADAAKAQAAAAKAAADAAAAASKPKVKS